MKGFLNVRAIVLLLTVGSTGATGGRGKPQGGGSGTTRPSQPTAAPQWPSRPTVDVHDPVKLCGSPPSEPGVKFTATDAFPAVAVPIAGVPGGTAGVIVTRFSVSKRSSAATLGCGDLTTRLLVFRRY